MSSEAREKPGFWETVRLLLGVARRRSDGRIKRQQHAFYSSSGGGSGSLRLGKVGFVLTALFMVVLNMAAAWLVGIAVATGERLEVQRQGKIVVSSRFLEEATAAENQTESSSPPTERTHVPLDYFSEARKIADENGGDSETIEQQLRTAFQQDGTNDFVAGSKADQWGLAGLTRSGRLSAMLGSWMLIAWFAMLVCQGEGLDLDLQRRRDPIWEWLFSHPAPPAAIFLAELLSPIPGSPAYWGAPLFTGALYSMIYGLNKGLLAAVVAGVPITVAAACLGKALEVGIMLRFSPRTRGAMIGLMGWIGYSSTMLILLGMFALPVAITALGRFLTVFTVVPWPWLRLFVGGRVDGSRSFLLGVVACCLASTVIVSAAVWFSIWAAGQGLSGNFAGRPGSLRRSAAGAQFGRDPLYRKEFLWFIRDRSAIVQAVLIPLTIAGIQLFNLSGLMTYTRGTWNYLCGAAILFGTYFLWILGPKSLLSEGNALWIALTWPRGLESLLKSKAWLWSLVAGALVLMVLAYTAFLFPAESWKIALVAVGWYFFGRSMSEKGVTLVTVTSSSGEPQRVPWSRRLAAQLGMLTFAIGVVTQQWHIAIMGIVYSYITAAAMWQNLRARLPYLFDPWSETLPAPPTLMHAMIAISILVEGGALATGLIIAFAGGQNIAIARPITYAVCAVLVCVGVANFLNNRGVSLRDVWRWPASRPSESESWWRRDEHSNGKLVLLLLAGASGGVLLGLFAHGYSAAVSHIPAVRELMRQSQEQTSKIPNLKISYAVMAVIFAPFAEEYLFRGLLFRALDHEWGGWRALVGGAAFFAIYHSPVGWLPVALVGLTNEVLFKKTGWLAPAIVLHMVYNAVVLL